MCLSYSSFFIIVRDRGASSPLYPSQCLPWSKSSFILVNKYLPTTNFRYLLNTQGIRHPGPVGTLLPLHVRLSWEVSPRYSFYNPGCSMQGVVSKREGNNSPSSLPLGSYKRYSCHRAYACSEVTVQLSPALLHSSPYQAPLEGCTLGATNETESPR